MVYVLEGSLELVYDEETYHLEEEDCLYCDSKRLQSMRGCLTKGKLINLPAALMLT
jgi:mannose-6-phosphate isomerase-like protein (cupin superfamily)